MKTILDIAELDEEYLLENLGTQVSPDAIIFMGENTKLPLICFILKTLDPNFVFSFDNSSQLFTKLLGLKVNLNTFGTDLLSPLQILVSQGNNKKMIVALLTNGASLEYTAESTSPLPLYAAASNNKLDIVSLLLKYGANIEGFSYAKETALMVACSNGNQTIVEVLTLNGANVDAKNINGTTPLICAAQGGHTEIGAILVKAGANKLEKDNSGKNATDYACICHDPVLAEGFRSMGIPDKYSLSNIEDNWKPKENYDLFFSYRHLHYRDKIDRLKDLARKNGLRVFVDVDDLCIHDIQAPDQSTDIIKSRLKFCLLYTSDAADE